MGKNFGKFPGLLRLKIEEVVNYLEFFKVLLKLPKKVKHVNISF